MINLRQDEFKTRLINLVNDFRKFNCDFHCKDCILSDEFRMDGYNSQTFCDVLNDLSDYREVKEI